MTGPSVEPWRGGRGKLQYAADNIEKESGQMEKKSFISFYFIRIK